MRMHAVDAELLDAQGVRGMLPFLDFDNGRFPVLGGAEFGFVLTAARG